MNKSKENLKPIASNSLEGDPTGSASLSTSGSHSFSHGLGALLWHNLPGGLDLNSQDYSLVWRCSALYGDNS